MSWNQSELNGSNNTSTSANYSYLNLVQKPIEMYVFIDPLCPECWSLEPYLRKLAMEYGRFFTVRPIVTGLLNSMSKDTFGQPRKLKEIWERTAMRTGMSCDGDLWLENPVYFPTIASLAIKAAELQGKRAGRVFLRRLQESLFLMKQNISDKEVLIKIAKEAKLDIDEFEVDLYSTSAKKALQDDIKLTQEMEVDYIPTIVLFNQAVDEQGIKVSGLYPYEIYELVLQEMLQRSPIPSEKPPLEEFIKHYEVVGSKEISIVYNWTMVKTEKEMKKLQFSRKVERIPVKYGSFWKYIS
ncbi:dithiol-disulfide isomerase [Oceanobacillus arenosus]|uniref:ClpXP adapter protein SpxH n=1 Tax=Oceanobacillus arenosus TaxID=1229153 RepID=A0A3D8PQ54_9BACI|nr:ClpXP adapter SpxH family protein [Oceanobacillus arenosus]RDW18276.1 dithiol-disulfide isomerase [Oceanobacillus arenosus]